MRILHSKKLVFISKPRCGSTSVRFLLNKSTEHGDVICDAADQERGLHPHMSATAIKAFLRKEGHDPDEYTYFTVTRHPVEMLWSYYRFFQLDENSRYNYDIKHTSETLMPFLTWIQSGRVGIGRYWADFVPNWISAQNFSPLSLEAHICDRDGRIDVDRWFYIEDQVQLTSWLSDMLGFDSSISHVNQAPDGKCPEIEESVLTSLVTQFPMEAEHYKIGMGLTP